MPPIRNEIQTAAPATAPASPRRAKMPAPIIEPIPRTVAPRTVSAPAGRGSGSDVVAAIGSGCGRGSRGPPPVDQLADLGHDDDRQGDRDAEQPPLPRQ